jgi:hypothetical protein
MATNPFLSDALKPDGGRAAHLPLGLFSPMWLPFMAAAGVGAAWWTMQNWPRLIGAAGSTNAGAGGNGATPAGAAPAGAAPTAVAQTGAAQTSGQAEAVVRSYQPEPTPANDAPAAPVAQAITESVAVQGAETAEAPPAKPAKAAPRPAAASAPKAAMVAPPPVVEREEAHTVAHEGHDEHAKPEPELPPHEGLPARKKGGGKKKA